MVHVFYFLNIVHERGEKGTCLLGPRCGNLADHLPNIARQEGDMVLWLVIEVINTVAPEGKITIVDIHRRESKSKSEGCTAFNCLVEKGEKE